MIGVGRPPPPVAAAQWGGNLRCGHTATRRARIVKPGGAIALWVTPVIVTAPAPAAVSGSRHQRRIVETG
jgi:hypothetical protein